MKKIILIITISNLFLFSCNTVRDSAGVNRKVIDEYAVIENPPLIIPPNYNLLPPENIESKNIENTDSELAKEILFGLDNKENQTNNDNSLMNEIIRETEANDVDNDIRDVVNEAFAGEKSTIDDETSFKSNEELNEAIKETEKKGSVVDKKIEMKDKKKKRFFFF